MLGVKEPEVTDESEGRVSYRDDKHYIWCGVALQFCGYFEYFPQNKLQVIAPYCLPYIYLNSELMFCH